MAFISAASCSNISDQQRAPSDEYYNDYIKSKSEGLKDGRNIIPLLL